MAIGTTLKKRGDEWWVAFGRDEEPEAPLPGLTLWIDRYIDHYHPYLAARSINSIAGNALWVSATGKPLTPKQVGQIISRRTKREIGRDFNPHLFRKLVPTELAIHDPVHVGVAQPLLGHADYRACRLPDHGEGLQSRTRH